MYLKVWFLCMFVYSMIQMKINAMWTYLLINSQMAQSVRKTTLNLTYDIKSTFSLCKVEPPYPYWSIYSSNRELLMPVPNYLLNTDAGLLFNELLNIFKDTQNKTDGEHLITLRVDDVIFSHIYKEDRTEYAVDIIKSRKHFLSIEYSHPDMANKIIIELDPAIYIVGNEVLSSHFVSRYLHYQSDYYVFDDEYTLDIMDSKIKMISLNKDEYIIMGKTEYEIVKRV